MEIDLIIVILVSASIIMARRIIKRKDRIIPKKDIEMKDVDVTKFNNDGPFVNQ